MTTHFNMSFLAKKLTKLGLSNLESQVYIGLLQRECTTAGALAKYLNLKRSTIYTILDSLIVKGMVNITQIDSVKHYQAEPSRRLADFLQKQQEELNAKQQTYNEIVKDLEALHQKKLKPPKITIYEGKASIKNLLQRNLDDQPAEILVIGEYAEENDPVPEYTKVRINKKIPTRIIIADTKFGRDEMQKNDYKSYRKTYLLSPKHKFPASIHVYDQSVAIFTHTKSEPVGVYIENQDISTTLKMMFEIIEKHLK